MLLTYVRTAVIVLLAVLAFPRAGSAGFMDFVWEMSGPQMIGYSLVHCEYDPAARETECRPIWRGGLPQARKVWWFTFDAAAYTSTAEDAKEKDGTVRAYEWLDVGMVAFEPMLKWRFNNWFHHGAGFSYDFLFGDKFRRFDKFGLKFEPFNYEFNVRGSRWVAGYTGRLYPNGFTNDEFGFVPRLVDEDRKREWVHGAGLSFAW